MSDIKNRYAITQSMLPSPSKRRSGIRMPRVRFLVAHDTGNPRSTARNNVSYYTRTAQEVSASAHLFVDDKEIIECVPAFANAEKAWHVWYSTPIDNELYGVNANDCAIGIEYCYGDNINADEAYKRYVWVLARLCDQYGLKPDRDIVGHFFLDPKRKTDPVTGLAHSRRSYEQLLRDVLEELKLFTGKHDVVDLSKEKDMVTVGRVNVREGKPSTMAPISRVLGKGSIVRIVGGIDDGQAVNGNRAWFKTDKNEWIWSGGLQEKV
jgi:N-acetylmuramoyl-L-alanine amidase